MLFDDPILRLIPQPFTWYHMDGRPSYFDTENNMRYGTEIDNKVPGLDPPAADSALNPEPAVTPESAPANFALAEQFAPAERFVPAEFAPDQDFAAGGDVAAGVNFGHAPEVFPTPEFALPPDFPPAPQNCPAPQIAPALVQDNIDFAREDGSLRHRARPEHFLPLRITSMGTMPGVCDCLG